MSKGPTLVAIAQEADRLRAVGIQTGPEGPKVVWTRSTEPGQMDWVAFANACGVATDQGQNQRRRINQMLVVGLRPVGVAFYRLQLPPVPHSQLDSIIRMQVEARLPLAADQIEMAWRQLATGHDHITALVAAARRRHVQGLVDQVRPLAPKRLYLSSEAMVKAWVRLFDDGLKDVAVMSLESHNTQVCLVDHGVLGDMGMIDLGLDDLCGQDCEDAQQQFILDLRSILEAFPRRADGTARPLMIMSDGSSRFDQVVQVLQTNGLEANCVRPRPEASSLGLTCEQLYEYRTAIGLALIAIDDEDGLQLFINLYQPIDQQAQQEVVSTRAATGLVIVALVGALIVAYVTDVAMAKKLKGLVERYKLLDLKSQLDTREQVSRYRIDILGLLSEINSAVPSGPARQPMPDPNAADRGPGMERGPRFGRSGGIVLDSFSFKRGQTITIEGQADSPEDLYRFEEALRKKEGIRSVETKKSTQDKQTNRIKFSINFHYKNFTQKGVR
ncbi:MAG: PilN domain-containing protein [Sedimentisphaerales bacterium]|nr:PilN domain-containing protein [Sedimentisphaerales bacterium]